MDATVHAERDFGGFVGQVARGGANRSLRPIPRGPEPASRFGGPALLVGSSASLQTSAALATTVFAIYGPYGTGALRFAFAAPVLMVLVRPALRGRSRRFWLTVVASGASLAALNFALYAAIARAPLATVVTLQFIGPLTFALRGARRPLDVLCVVAAGAGVVALTGARVSGSGVGVALALFAAGLTVVVVVLSRELTQQSRGLDGLAFEVAAAAALTLPFAVHAVVEAPAGSELGLVALVAALGITVPYTLEYVTLKMVSIKTFGVLLSLDPAIAALAGALWLGQLLAPRELLGIALVVIASTAVMSSRTSR